jgi:2',3'-cyclic-nucleotide 2'-phosphodiesterase (5'-nucleotidase family)
VTLGNHEFDYQIPRLTELTQKLDAAVVSCNFVNASGDTVYEPYTIISYGDTDVAYLGICTPETFTKSTPAYFQDENGEYIYDFCGDNLYEAVQKSVDDARKDGAEYVIALTHLGSEGVTERWSAQAVISNTSGIDAILDGHSHSVIENSSLQNKNGENVTISSVGTKLANLGKLTISADGSIKTELIPLDTYEKTDSSVEEYVSAIKSEYESKTSEVIGKSEVNLTTLYDNGERAVRKTETNLGDLCADAYREVLDADVGFINGGGIRANIAAGNITYNDILSVFPWNNQVCAAKVTGQQLLDALEFSVSAMPDENGGFQQVSGITFDVDLTVSTPVIKDDKGMFVSAEGERRIKNAKILNRKTNTYEALDPQKQYILASHSYLLKNYGDGFTMFKGVEITRDSVMLDNELLARYIQNNLGGVIGSDYAAAQNRINASSIPLRKTFENLGMTVEWHAPDTIVVSYANQSLTFKIGSNIATNGESSVEMEKSAELINDTTYISYDAIALLEIQ